MFLFPWGIFFLAVCMYCSHNPNLLSLFFLAPYNTKTESVAACVRSVEKNYVYS